MFLLRSYGAEKDLSTKENSEKTGTWFPGENEHQGWASCPQSEATQRSPEIDGGIAAGIVVFTDGEKGLRLW